MMLKSFGCSFIYGSDLPDGNGYGEPYELASQLTWPALLAQNLGYNYQCHARPGSGNLRILEKILSMPTKDSEVFVIGWSWIDRFDYTVDPTEKEHAYDLAGANVWRTVMPVDIDGRAKNYYRDLHSQYRDKLTSLSYIKLAIDTLKQRSVPFIMTYMDELLFETTWHTNSAISNLQNYVIPYMTKFEGQTFLEWTKKKKFPISKTLHPLEQAHQAGFELIKSYNLV